MFHKKFVPIAVFSLILLCACTKDNGTSGQTKKNEDPNDTTVVIPKPATQVRLVYWNIQNGMWDGEADNYDSFVTWVKGKNPDICVWCEAVPTYNWDEMIKDDCAWWVRRFQNMNKFFEAYRIDHVLGFFRIWEIPVDAVHGLLGQF